MDHTEGRKIATIRAPVIRPDLRIPGWFHAGTLKISLMSAKNVESRRHYTRKLLREDFFFVEWVCFLQRSGAMKRKVPPPVFVLRGHTSGATSVQFSDSGALLASGDADGTLLTWDVESRRCVARYEHAHTKDRSVACVHFVEKENAQLWTQGRDGCIKLWDLDAQRCVSAHDVRCEGFVGMSVSKQFACMPDPTDLKVRERRYRELRRCFEK